MAWPNQNRKNSFVMAKLCFLHQTKAPSIRLEMACESLQLPILTMQILMVVIWIVPQDVYSTSKLLCLKRRPYRRKPQVHVQYLWIMFESLKLPNLTMQMILINAKVYTICNAIQQTFLCWVCGHQDEAPGIRVVFEDRMRELAGTNPNNPNTHGSDWDITQCIHLA